MVNIVICGTPGTGKSTLVEEVQKKLKNIDTINLSIFAKDNDCIEEYDEELDTHIIDEEKLSSLLKPRLEETKSIPTLIECIHPSILPEDKVDWLFVCRTNNTILYDRLKLRNYNEVKLTNNLESEIFQLIQDEALETFGDSIVTIIQNDKTHDIESNCNLIMSKLKELERA